jgi:hypothetical protein
MTASHPPEAVPAPIVATGDTVAPQPYAGQIAALHHQQPATGPIGRVRDTGTCMLLCLVTLGIYALVWYYHVHDEMKRHTGEGLGGGLGLVVAWFVGIVSPFLASSEIGKMYERRGEHAPVSGATGLWYMPGMLILVGPFVWFVKTNGALNSYWRSLGAR